jgi:16S rRNA (adenine1518-N6/adenine1519-N6)-dimethyltransferase
MGAMTSLLLERGARVQAFEIDEGFAELLETLFGGKPFSLVRGDVLKTWETEGDTSPYLLGNLPYTIAALLVGKLIEGRRFFKRMVITVQKEVALRMAAAPGSKNYSSISVLCSSAYKVKKLLTLKGASFYPAPHVDSTALCLYAREEIPEYGELFFPMVRSLFEFRRKTLGNNLENFLGRWCTLQGGVRIKDAMGGALEKSGIPPGVRAEQLGLEEFSALALALKEICTLRKKG